MYKNNNNIIKNIFLIIIQIEHKDLNKLVSDKSNSLIFYNCKYNIINAVQIL